MQNHPKPAGEPKLASIVSSFLNQRPAMQKMKVAYRYLFDSAYGAANHFLARWLFLRALGLIYFSAFFALLFQIRGLIGAQGILPAADYLHAISPLGVLRLWYAPTLLWLSSSDRMLMAICW